MLEGTRKGVGQNVKKEVENIGEVFINKGCRNPLPTMVLIKVFAIVLQ